MTTLRSFFNWLLSTRMVRTNPVTQVKLARLDQKGRVEFCLPELCDKLSAGCLKADNPSPLTTQHLSCVPPPSA